MKRILSLAIGMLTFSAIASLAHDTWIVCDPSVVPSGRVLSVRITSGEKFPVVESAPDAARVAKAEWRIGGKRGTITDFKKEDKSLAASGHTLDDGVAVIAVAFKPMEIELTPEKVAEYMEEIAAPASVRHAYEQDGAAAGWHETYTKHAKTYVRVGSGGDAGGALGPVGFNIDFLPDSDPTALKVGDTLAMKVIRGGNEMESLPVMVVCAATGEAVMPRTNKTGMMLVKITSPGWWLVRTAELRRKSAGVWQSDFTTMTFYVEKVETPRDIAILFVTRGARLFAYGFLSVILALYLDSIGLSKPEIGLLLTLAMIGDALVSFWITTSADRVGRRRMLIAGALLMAVGGAAFASTGNAVLLMIIATIGVFSPSGSEVGPFLSIEQASLSQLVPASKRTHIFARYVLTGAFATATGALVGGAGAGALLSMGLSTPQSYRVLLWCYCGFGLLLAALFLRLSRHVEAPASATKRRFGLHRSRGAVIRLSALFAMDAFAGGFIVQSLLALWFHLRFGFDVTKLGALFFGVNVMAGFSALLAARLAARIGLINTMVFTHLPSNLLLMLVPLMPNATLAVVLMLVRYSISQMDVPTRQSYTMAIVDPDERSAAAGITGIARSVGSSVSPALSGALMANAALIAVPFYLAGGLKIVYDLLVYRGFKSHRPPEE